MASRFFSITTPIYYVNAKPHIGHTYTTIACDTLARYHRLNGEDVFFLTGTDEHGDKIVRAAEKEGMTPQQYTDEISGKFEATWKELHISNDDYIRTTQPRHKEVVQRVLQKLYDSGDIYLSSYRGKYCFGCERYLTDKELDENGNCPDHQVPPEEVEESNYFFRMQKYLSLWKEHLQKHPDIISPERYRNEVLGVIDELVKGGEDLSISRPKARLEWGIELPFDKDYVAYVWFDALLNYVSALGYPDGERYQKYWPSTHMIAKDILKPHGVYWPAMLMAAEIPLYNRLIVHGYWLGMNDFKMSKSLGNALDPYEMRDALGEDGLRFFLMREMNFGSDARISEEILLRRLNTDLANDLGNLVQRTLSMLKKYFGGIVAGVEEHELASAVNDLLAAKSKEYHTAFAEAHFSRAIESIFEVVRVLNQAIEENKPWAMAKENSPALKPFLHTLLRGISAVLRYLSPVLTRKASELLEAIGAQMEETFPVKLEQVMLTERELDTWPVLFQRLEEEKK